MTDDETRELYGRLFALEAMLTHVIWNMAMDSRHPPTKLASYLQPIEEKMAAMAREPGADPVAMQAAQDTVRGIGEALFDALTKESLRRATPEGSGRS